MDSRCDYCQRISVKRMICAASKLIDDVIEHHQTYTDLANSAAAGCDLCALLESAWLEWASHYTTLTEEGLKCHHCIERHTHSNCCGKKFFVIPDRLWTKSETRGGGHQRLLRGFRFHPFSLDQFKDKGLHLQGPILLFRTEAGQPEGDIVFRYREPESSIPLYRSWYDSCRLYHRECDLDAHQEAPTRLLHWKWRDDDSFVRLVLPKSSHFEYAALSHCWGKVLPMQTTIGNLQSHMNGIPFATLSTSFQDAFQVARQLDLEFLWIDSLCIIQDDRQDWEEQCPRMENVYKNALVTIIAADAENSLAGFLKMVEPSKVSRTRSCQLDHHITVEYDWDEARQIPGIDNSLTSTRGWVLQERLLSKRCLSFRAGQINWECNRACLSDDLNHQYAVSYLGNGYTPKEPLESLTDPKEIREYWIRIVESYSYRKLTNPEDKLPALSGMARAISAKLNDEYLAGLWKSSLPYGLTWSCYDSHCCVRFKGHHVAMPTDARVSGYRAPSWSWASVDFPVYYEDWLLPYHDMQLKILSACTRLSGTDSFGQVAGGILQVQGWLKPWSQVAVGRNASWPIAVLYTDGLQAGNSDSDGRDEENWNWASAAQSSGDLPKLRKLDSLPVTSAAASTNSRPERAGQSDRLDAEDDDCHENIEDEVEESESGDGQHSTESDSDSFKTEKITIVSTTKRSPCDANDNIDPNLNRICTAYIDHQDLADNLNSTISAGGEIYALLISRTKNRENWVGLALEKCSDREHAFQFKRIGLLFCFGEDYAGRRWFDDAKQQTLEII